MAIVAPLAQRRQIHQAARFWSMVEDVRRRQHHPRPRHRMWLVVFCTAPLTSILRPDEANEPGADFPVSRITRLVLWSDWHGGNCVSGSTVRHLCQRMTVAPLGMAEAFQNLSTQQRKRGRDVIVGGGVGGECVTDGVTLML